MKTKTIIIYALIIFLIVLVAGWIIVYATNKPEPIQEILNQIELNNSELQQLEIKQAELNQANEQAKEKLKNEFWLQITEEEKTENPTNPEWTPWQLTEDWTHQEMPAVEWADEHEKFKSLASSYGLDASQIRAVENHYGIKEWVILCITIAETSGGNRGAWWKNIGSVWSNDRGDRPTYALMESWLEDIGKTLNNKYLWSKNTLWCLSNAGSCKESNDNGKRYATSESSRQKNMVACLSTIYWNVDASTFTIRR